MNQKPYDIDIHSQEPMIFSDSLSKWIADPDGCQCSLCIKERTEVKTMTEKKPPNQPVPKPEISDADMRGFWVAIAVAVLLWLFAMLGIFAWYIWQINPCW